VAARDRDVPRYSYVLTVFVGLIALSSVYTIIDFLSARLLGEFLGGASLGEYADGAYRHAAAAVGLFALANAVLGAFFGLVWPEKTWRWGVWLCALPACLLSFLEPGAVFFLSWVAVTLLPTCAGAAAAGRLHLKYTEVEGQG
jgi:hypothetical protein